MATYPYRVTKADGGETMSGGTLADKINTGNGGTADNSIQNSNFQRTYTFDVKGTKSQISLVEKPSAVRIGNTSNVRCEIRYGKKFEYNQVFLNIA